MADTALIEIRHLQNFLGGKFVHSDVNLSIMPREILAIIGGSGSGKTTILRSILMLLEPTAGDIKLFGQDIKHLDADAKSKLRQRMGMLFQHSALFSGMTVLENIMFPLLELTKIPRVYVEELALLKLLMVGLTKDSANKYPSDLSGGMQRRAAAARAIAMDPEILLFDEPTAGLDPVSAKKFDELTLFLRDNLGITIIIVSHDLESLRRTVDRAAFIGEGVVLDVAPLEQLQKNKHRLIANYFSQL
jgi:phospholipid/cholesterol/gamma-HCH transport system ATP-binding protein